MDENETPDNYDEDETPYNCDQNKTPDGYEVGYGKPPKHTRFQKGVSGNPKGRPKDAPEFDAALLREAKSRITINENGRRVRVSKHDVIIKQLINNAMKGKNADLRMFREAYRQAFEKAALSGAPNPELGKRAEDLTDEQLAAILFAALEEQKKG